MTEFLDLYGFLSVLLRGLSLAAQAVVFGSACFLVLIPAAKRADEVDSATTAYADAWRWILRASMAALVTLASAAALNAAALIQATGMTWADVAGARFVVAAAIECATLAMLAALACARPSSSGAHVAAVVAAYVVLCASVAISHAAARPDGRVAALAATLLHQMGASVWIGGLPVFYATLRAGPSLEFRGRIARRFSTLATAGVGLVVLGALLLAVQYVGSIASLYGTSYGMMVFTKTVLLLLLLALGFLNRRLSRRVATDARAPQQLRRFVELEVFVGLAAFMLAASLSSAPPGADLAGLGAQVTLQEIGHRIAPRTPRFESPDPASLAIAERQARFDADARSEGVNGSNLAYSPGSGEPPPRNAQDIAWSEYNHHWAGMVLLLLGIVTLVEWLGRGRWVRWARHWPLLFIVLAVFIAWRADPKVWPMGSIGFVASLRDPEVVQHRVFALLIAALGVFEWRVRHGRFASSRSALFFPLLTVAGSILLLTHTHAIGNVKEEALIEITHLPLSVLGLVAGAARWLELRGDEHERRLAGAVWRIAFIVVGLLLLGYQEA